MIEFIIPGPPKGKQRPRVCRNGITYTPKETTTYENFVKEIYMINKLPMIEGPIKAEVAVQYEVPKSTSKKQKALMLLGHIRPTKKPDIDNILKIIFDSLNGIAYKDDNQIVQVSCYKAYAERPKVIVRFYKLEED